MFFFLRPQPLEHYVDDGSVYCPRRSRDVEIDVCTGCEWLTGIDLNAQPPYVRCEGTLVPAMPQRG